jgi:hypothetical protein
VGRPGQLAGASARLLRIRRRPIKPTSKEAWMTHDDVLFGYRLRLFTLAQELGSVSEA